MKLFVLVLRLLLGGLFFGHGMQKLKGWFGGHGPEGTGAFFESLGLRPGRQHALAAGASEAGGGALLALGLLTPVAGTLLAIVMLNAIGSVTFKKGFMLGSELELTYLTVAVSLAAIGPGRFSLDRAFGWDDNISGVWWGVLALGAALVVSFVTLTLGRARRVGEQEVAPQA